MKVEKLHFQDLIDLNIADKKGNVSLRELKEYIKAKREDGIEVELSNFEYYKRNNILCLT